jgi:HPt (histidine-containing phosphotransfer) domain-containing protein
MIDRRVALERMGGDPQLLREVARLFSEHAPLWLEQSAAALKAGDTKTLKRLSHTIKTSADNLGARVIVETAQSIENLAGQNELDDAQTALERLDQELRQMLKEVLELATVAADSA